VGTLERWLGASESSFASDRLRECIVICNLSISTVPCGTVRDSLVASAPAEGCSRLWTCTPLAPSHNTRMPFLDEQQSVGFFFDVFFSLFFSFSLPRSIRKDYYCYMLPPHQDHVLATRLYMWVRLSSLQMTNKDLLYVAGYAPCHVLTKYARVPSPPK
jgi:hypothetical protein